MNRSCGTGRALCCLLTLALLMTGLLGTVSASAAEAGDREYIVKYRTGIGRSGDQGMPFSVVDEGRMKLLRQAGMLAWYEEDGYGELLDEDPRFYDDEQWNLDMIGAAETFRQGYLGQGIRVGVLDSGINPHADLAANLSPGHNYMEDARDPEDTLDAYGHGTRVAGLISGAGDNGYIGAAPRATLVPLKVTDGKSVRISAICRAIYGGVDDYACDVLNLSLGVTSEYQSLREAVAYAEEHHVVVVSAVGNGGSAAIYYPARYDSVIGVGSVDATGGLYYRSNHNASVFLTAPGAGVRSTAAAGGYMLCTGTSFAVPQVSAAAAVLLGMDRSLTPGEIRDLLAGTAMDRGAEGYDEYYGYGVLNLAGCAEALAARMEDPDVKWDSDYMDCPRTEVCPMAAFHDLRLDAWYHDGVHWALKNGIMNGTGDQLFRPDLPASRAMLVAMLYRMEGSPREDGTLSFLDVPEDGWYAGAVRWAVRYGIVTGYSAERFGPGDALSREQLVTILRRYAAYRGENVTGSAETDLDAWSDGEEIARWARESMQWAVKEGIIRGVGEDRLSPKAPASRAQIATILLRQCGA